MGRRGRELAVFVEGDLAGHGHQPWLVLGSNGAWWALGAGLVN